MTEFVCRPAAPADRAALKALWTASFGDSEEDVDLFLTRMRGRAVPFAVEREGEILSALWALDCAFAGEKAAYLYAVATRADARHEGLATALMRYALGELERRGVTKCWLYPANAALHTLYRPLGFAPCAPARRLILPAAGQAPLTPLPAPQAADRRAALLHGKNAVDWDAAALAFAAESADGAWYDVGDGIALLCPRGKTLAVPEWLAPDPRRAAAFAAAFGCERVEVAFPFWIGTGEPLPPPLARGMAPDYAGLTMA